MDSCDGNKGAIEAVSVVATSAKCAACQLVVFR